MLFLYIKLNKLLILQHLCIEKEIHFKLIGESVRIVFFALAKKTHTLPKNHSYRLVCLFVCACVELREHKETK